MKGSKYTEPYEEWLLKANNDLLSSKHLFEIGLNDTAIYHTQQCAEKSLKAYWAFKIQPIQHTHDLIILNDGCKKLDAAFMKLNTATFFLNNMDTRFRYPGDDLEPSGEEVANAIEYAEFILTFVKNKIFKKQKRST